MRSTGEPPLTTSGKPSVLLALPLMRAAGIAVRSFYLSVLGVVGRWAISARPRALNQAMVISLAPGSPHIAETATWAWPMISAV